MKDLRNQLNGINRSGFVKSLQRGTVVISGSTSNTTTITSVTDLNNSRLCFMGWFTNSATDTADKVFAALAFTNATTITGSVVTSPGASIVTIGFEVIEYWPGVIRSLQRGTGTVASPATINAVDMNKSTVDFLGITQTSPSLRFDLLSRVSLTNSTTVTGTAGIAGGIQTFGYQVVEWN